jgi:hypothetical protein
MSYHPRFSRKSSLPRGGSARPFGSLPKLDERYALKRCIDEAELAVKERRAFLVLSRHQAGQTIDAVGKICGNPAAACRMNAWVDTRMSNILGPSDDVRDALYPVPAARVMQATESLRQMRLSALYGVSQSVAHSKRSGPRPVKEESLEDLRRRKAELFQLYGKSEKAVTVLVEVVEHGTALIESYIHSD